MPPHRRRPVRASRDRPRSASSRRRFRRPILEALEDRRLLAAFTPGNLVVYRVGELFGGLSTNAAPVFLDEINTQVGHPDFGQIVQTLPLPTSAAGNQRALTASGTIATEGLMTRSGDGQYLMLTGYAVGVGASVGSSTTSAAVNRVVGRVDALGNIDTSTVIADGYSGGNIRSAVSPDGTSIWTSGSSNNANATGGVRALQFGHSGPTTRVNAVAASTRAIDIFDDQLFASVNAGLPLGKVGTGTPQTTDHPIAPLVFPPGTLPSDPHQFFFADLSSSEPGLDTLYIADAGTGVSGGLRKYSFVNGALAYNSNIVLASQGVRGLTGTVSGGVVTLYATNTEETDNDIWKVVDAAGWNSNILASGASIFHTGIPGTAFRGLAMAPEALAPPPTLSADYGDAPDSYSTLAAGGGPLHAAIGPTLGASRDIEADAAPSPAATGDNNAGASDEDGIAFLAPLLVSTSAPHVASIAVTASAASRLDAWIDFNRNGAFDDAAERITLPSGTTLAAGSNLLSVTIPAGATIGSSFARFRLSSTGGLSPGGAATDGEVEDHAVSLISDAGANVTINLPAGGGSYSLETSGGQLRLQQGATTVFSTPANTIDSLAILGGFGDVLNVTGPVDLPGAVTLTTQQINFPLLASTITAASVALTAFGGAITDDSLATASITATSLEATATGGIELGTDVASLTANSVASGPITIQEANAIVLTSVVSANGPIDIEASGAVIATNIVSLADNDLNDIKLTAAGGDLSIGAILAGGVAADVALATSGRVLDLNGGAANIEADALSLVGIIGVGSLADPIETSVANLTANIGSAGIFVANTGDLTIGGVAPLPGITTLGGGDIDVRTTGNLHLEENLVAGGTGTDLTLVAGGNITAGHVLLAATGVITLQIDANSVTPGVGAILTIPAGADIDAASAVFIGGAAADTFQFRPDDEDTANIGGFISTPIAVQGGGALNDTLTLDLAGISGTGLLVNGLNGTGFTFADAAAVTHTSIEQVNVTPTLSSYHLTIEMNGPLGAANGAAADIITVQANGANLEVLVAGVNGGAPIFSSPQATIDSLTVLGSADDDLLNINETPSGLPLFANPAAGASGGHTSPTFTSHAGYNQAGSTPVDVHFNGGAGNDQLLVNLSGPHALVYTSDALDTNRSGNVGIGSGASLTSFGTPQLGLSFEDLTGLSLNGPGSSLLVDASSSPAADVTALTIAAGANPADGVTTITPNAASTSFVSALSLAGVTALLVRSGDAADTLDLHSLDTANSLFTGITLDADNLTNGDTSADTVRVQSTNGLNVPVTLLAGRGNDTFQVLTSPLGGSIDAVAGAISVSPVAGSFIDDSAANDIDALFIDDRGDADHDKVTITEGSIEGLTGFAGTPDITYQRIDTLNVTGTAGNNTFDVPLNPGSDLDTVTVNGNSGDDQFYLDLNTADSTTNAVAGLVSVTLSGDAGQDVFGQTPDNAPHAGTGLPAIPLPPAPLPAPSSTSSRGQIASSSTTIINLSGGLNNSTSSGASTAGNATQGNEFGPAFDLVNLDITPSSLNPSALAYVATVNGVINTTGFKNITFNTTEAINLTDQDKLTRVVMGDLYLRGTSGNDIMTFGATGNPNVASMRANGYIFSLPVTLKTVAYGRGGNDQIVQGNLNRPAEFYGEIGDDYLAGYNFNDLLVGGLGFDRVLGGEGANELWGDNLHADLTTIEATDGPDQLTGGSGIDRMYGGGHNDTINGAGGNDYAFGGGGDDTIDGGPGDDRLYGGAGHDTISGGDGNDLLAGNDGDDKLYGKAGNDVLIGGIGPDLLFGEEGNDLLIGGVLISANPPAGNDASTIASDVNDQAMAAILATWALGGLPPGLTAPEDDAIDTLGGMSGDDTAAPTGADTGDWDNLLP